LNHIRDKEANEPNVNDSSELLRMVKTGDLLVWFAEGGIFLGFLSFVNAGQNSD